jgi:hypothetical protein
MQTTQMFKDVNENWMLFGGQLLLVLSAQGVPVFVRADSNIVMNT